MYPVFRTVANVFVMFDKEVTPTLPTELVLFIRYRLLYLDPTFSSTLLSHAEELFKFAESHPGKYSESISDANAYYR